LAKIRSFVQFILAEQVTGSQSMPALTQTRDRTLNQSDTPPTVVPPKDNNPFPWYTPRGWHGMRTGPWWRLMAQNHFRVAPSRIPMAMMISLAGPANDFLALIQHLRHRRTITGTPLTAPPVFILGHWRSGTTLLHELMMLDPRLSFPTTYECFAPSHFLVSEWVFERYLNWLLPGKRPMDNVAFGWSRPQEDEFALMNLGLPSPYRRMAFPRGGWRDMDYLDFEGVEQREIHRWLQTLKRFLQTVTVKRPGRLVLKSPTHTGRVAVLAKFFPGAKFIHISRDPRDLFPSTLKLWRSLDGVQGLQPTPTEPDREYVIEGLRRMYASFHADRPSLPAGSLVDIRYEDLVANPDSVLRSVYAELDLGDFDPVETPLRQWINDHHRGYEPNRHQLPKEDQQRIEAEWSDYFQRYGYDKP
jgi:hypothetical protein